MEKFLLGFATRLGALYLMLFLFSCEDNTSPPTTTSEATIEGTWILSKEHSHEGDEDQFKEFPLSNCDKKTTLEITSNGRFVEKSYFEDPGTGGECIKNNQDIKGRWEKRNDGSFWLIFNENNNLVFEKSKGVIEKGDLIITLQYNDKNLESDTMLKFTYSRVN